MQRNTKILWLVIGLIIVAGLIFAVKKNTPQSEKVVKIGYTKVVGSLPVHIASEKGLFEKNGVKVERVEFPQANQGVEAMVRGDIDGYSFISVFPLFSSELVDPGMTQIFALSDMTAEHPFDAVMVTRESPIASIANLAGKKIGVFPGSTGSTFLREYLTSKEVDVSKIEYVQLPPQNQLPALYAGSIDALYSYEPIITISLQSGKVRTVTGSIFAEQFNHSPIASHVLTTKFVHEYPDLAKKVVASFDDANAYIENNNSETRAFTETFYGLPKNVADNVSLTKMGNYAELDKGRLNQFVDYIVSLKELKSKPDLSNIFYTK